MSGYPEDLRYTQEHEWARVSGNVVTIGITKYAVEQLGDITYVGLPREGEEITKGDVFGTIESVKAQSDVFSPVSGTVAKINDPLEDNPEYVNDDPYDEGWMIQVEMTDPEDLSDMMDAKAYTEYVAELD
ncbi:MAG: glycine cleavage system protein GcvH [Deltaproteobacteria bacterium]|nr:glycine cleavage system protein GcvH [Deltaproteobacteria bacterium]